MAASSYDEYLTLGTLNFEPDLILLCAKEMVVKETDWNDPTPEIETIKYDIIDGNLLSFLTRIDDVLERLISALGEGKRVLICCDGSLSRSMTVIMYYLVGQKNQIYSPQIGSYFLSAREGHLVDWKIHPVFEKFLGTI